MRETKPPHLHDVLLSSTQWQLPLLRIKTLHSAYRMYLWQTAHTFNLFSFTFLFFQQCCQDFWVRFIVHNLVPLCRWKSIVI